MDQGRSVGILAAGEDWHALATAVGRARELVLGGEVRLLLHADESPNPSAIERQREEQEKLAALQKSQLKRYVFALPTLAGERIVKITETRTLGNALLGLAGASTARREHAWHVRAQTLGVAATSSLGFLELRRGPVLLRCANVQTPIDRGLEGLGGFLARELGAFGDAALEPLARALADAHARGFFHADLKAFHAFVSDARPTPQGPTEYRLLWIDLARVGFRVSRRRRIINLYQALRFVVPRRPEAEERFVTAYCSASGWYAREPHRALGVVRRFFAHKLRTHPYP